MKTIATYKLTATPDVIATSIKKDDLFNTTANEIFSQAPDVEGETELMCPEEKVMILIMPDGTPMTVSNKDACTASGFKAAYELTLKAAICKAKYIEYREAERNWIWAKTKSEYITQGWTLCID